ncbi:MAG: arsenosugar biosynthesis radical SAM (seleno)protein ArsS [Thermoanaerobaculia bacterium]
MISPLPRNSFDSALHRNGLEPLRRGPVTTLQINVGMVCNQACHHCHVEAGPTRTETMVLATVERIVELLTSNPEVEVLDLTGGAPELNQHFRRLVQCGRRSGLRIIDRCNLTVLEEPGQEDTAEFLAAHQVEIVASLPCYLQENVDRQRGGGVYERSISALQNLNRLGYGMPGTGLILNLVYNPGGASLPPPQAELEPSYRRELRSRFGLEFTNLLTLTNMPIRRFADFLTRTDQHSAYLSLLANHFNPATVVELMCRSLLSVGYDGRLYDCDFNQMLALPTSQGRETIWQLDSLQEMEGLPIATGSHCLGCTAGAGSSCSGALA